MARLFTLLRPSWFFCLILTTAAPLCPAAFQEAFGPSLAAPAPHYQTERIKVACVGDSITFGAGISDRENNSYPALLQSALGDEYEVGNFGFSGATLLKKGHKPYWEKPPFQPSLDFNPDIVVINLGANDATDNNWAHEGEFGPDYMALIATYRNLPSKPKVFICEILPIMPNHSKFAECTRNRESMTQIIREVARRAETPLIDLYSPFTDRNDLFPDGLHPNETGAAVMAAHVFTALTGKAAPAIEPVRPPSFQDSLTQDETGTSFEFDGSDEFSEIESEVGTWFARQAMVKIDNAHANTGTRCLQIAGEGAAVELVLGDDVNTSGQLTFHAERWTSRAPFSFRIEKKSGGNWEEIYDGDNEVRVGRAFLSKVVVQLGDDKIKSLRFTVNSPPETGILIDDLVIAPAQPQVVTAAEVVPLALPVLVGNPNCAVLKLKIETKGGLNPISLTGLSATLEGTTDLADIESMQLLFGGADAEFVPGKLKGDNVDAGNRIEFVTDQPLAEGANYFWVACTLKPTANIDNRIGAAVTGIKLSSGQDFPVAATPSIQQMGVAVRRGGDDAVHTYRIPGLATTNDGTLIGVYDVRRGGGGDLPGNIDVGMSRSTDGGRTWEPMQIIMDMGDDPKWNHDGIGDPSVLVDRETGTVWATATWSHGNRSWNGSGPGLTPEETGQFMLVRSDDDGRTWSDPLNITDQIKKPEWCFLLQGPGKGITLADGTLVFPAQYQDPPSSDNKRAHRLPHSTFIYSRDHGNTWSIATGAWDDTTEAQVVELGDGEIMINCRNNRASKRAIMTTTDMGETWTEHPTHVAALIEPGSCMASLINVGRELGWRSIEGFDNQTLLFSNPDSLQGRNHMTIKASTDSGMSWSLAHQLLLDEQGGRGYSCMSMIDAETVGILYEGSQADMTFQRVKLADIFQPPENQKTKNEAFGSTTKPVETFVDKNPNRSGDLSIARVFGDHMVLQTGQPIRIWGNAEPGAQISVSFGSQSVDAAANVDGQWLVELNPERPNAIAQNLLINSGGDSVAIKDVLVGEVWFCAGQSNMEWQLSKTTSGAEAIRRADDGLLRLLDFPGGARGGGETYGAEQFARLIPENYATGSWAVASAQSTKDFSGVGYYFARKLRRELDVPVGIINVSIGGTPIESWVAAKQLTSHPTLSTMFDGNWLDNSELDGWCRNRARSNLQNGLSGNLAMPGDEFGPNHSYKPGFMHAASVVPFQPMSFRGVLWYQGESNGDNLHRITQYSQAFPLLVRSWREEFRNPDMPWVFVQLPALGRPAWPEFREQQRRSLTQLNNVGMAITMDVGHLSNVHPPTKQPVGERMAAWALANTYGRKGVACGPLFRSATVRGDAMVVEFDQAGDGLSTSDAQPPLHFELAGADKVFQAAAARITGKDSIELKSKTITAPVHARYAWAPFPEPAVNLFNSAGIPASPFTTDDDFLKVPEPADVERESLKSVTDFHRDIREDHHEWNELNSKAEYNELEPL